jgi:phenylacetate-coenzyme A ligase PaaK-like adenylate-forming protein
MKRPGWIIEPEVEKESPVERETRLNEWLRETVLIAYGHAPRVKRTFDKLGLKPADIQAVGDLQKLPIVK